jgi:hydroxymethylpyrimidine pyrophosphatase-like HAD family hydrolase
LQANFFLDTAWQKAHNPNIEKLPARRKKMIREVHVYDMDGTIVDSLHRYRTIKNDSGEVKIDLPYWRENAHKAMEDSLLPLADQYRQQLDDPEVYVIIATAREMYAPDWEFVDTVLGKPDKVISRKHGDNIKGVELKSRPLRSLKNLKQFARAAWHFYEDNMEYLTGVCDKVGMVPHYIPSQQGY